MSYSHEHGYNQQLPPRKYSTPMVITVHLHKQALYLQCSIYIQTFSVFKEYLTNTTALQTLILTSLFRKLSSPIVMIDFP